MKAGLITILLLATLSCEKTIIEPGPPVEGKTYSIEGYAQKGPFIVGTDVTVAELIKFIKFREDELLLSMAVRFRFTIR